MYSYYCAFLPYLVKRTCKIWARNALYILSQFDRFRTEQMQTESAKQQNYLTKPKKKITCLCPSCLLFKQQAFDPNKLVNWTDWNFWGHLNGFVCVVLSFVGTQCARCDSQRMQVAFSKTRSQNTRKWCNSGLLLVFSLCGLDYTTCKISACIIC